MSAAFLRRVEIDQAMARAALLELTCAAWLADSACLMWLPLDRVAL